MPKNNFINLFEYYFIIFQARIKAILAQAALQASTNNLNANNENIDASLVNLGFPNFLNDNSGVNQFQNQLKNIDQTNDCSFFDSDQLIKFASSIDINETEPKKLEIFGETQEHTEKINSQNMNFSFNEKLLGKDLIESTQEDQMSSSIKKHISPSESPHHEFSCSLSSSDSGCRSTASFLAEEDSGKLLKKHLQGQPYNFCFNFRYCIITNDQIIILNN